MRFIAAEYGRIVAAHEADLEMDFVFGDGGESGVRVGKIQRERLFAEDGFPAAAAALTAGAWNLSGVAMITASMSLLLEHRFEAAERIIDFEFGGDLLARSPRRPRRRPTVRWGRDAADFLRGGGPFLRLQELRLPASFHSPSPVSVLAIWFQCCRAVHVSSSPGRGRRRLVQIFQALGDALRRRNRVCVEFHVLLDDGPAGVVVFLQRVEEGGKVDVSLSR